MRVLVASHLYPSSLSLTSGSFVHNQVRFLRAHCNIRVISPTPWFPPLPGFGRWSSYGRIKRQEVLDRVEVNRPPYLALPRRMLFAHNWRSYLAALHRDNSGPPDLIHAHCAYPDGLAAVEYGRRLGLPAVITVHGHDIKELPGIRSHWRSLVVRALEQAAVVIANGRDLRERVLDLGIPSHKVETIPNGVDCQVFCNDFARQPGAGGWRLLYVGRIDPRKGIGELLEAMAVLRSKRDDVRLKLIGGNPAGGLPDRFRRQMEKLGLQGCVEFLEEVPWDQVPQHMAAADVFVLPSLYESFGVVLVEAMACGLPLVATRCGGPSEIVEEGTGRLVEVADVKGLAEALDEVIRDHRSFDRVAIRRSAEEKYDYRQVAARIHQVYEEALAGYSGG